MLEIIYGMDVFVMLRVAKSFLMFYCTHLVVFDDDDKL